MKTYENERIRVILTDEQAEKWEDRRDLILSHAMSILGNRSEARILESEIVSDDEAKASALDELTYQYLAEHGRYNLNETIMRMGIGRAMPVGMWGDVNAAREYAKLELMNDPGLIELGRKFIESARFNEIQYRKGRGSSDWQIKIIGKMPKQIGMCRYQDWD